MSHSEENLESSQGVARRAFLAKIAAGVFAGLTAEATLVGADVGRNAKKTSALVPPEPMFPAPPLSIERDIREEDVLIRMQAEVARALRKPLRQRRWGMVIDTRKCIGCSSCTTGCVMENKLPPGVVYRPVITTEIGEYPNVTLRNLPRPCMQCENPPCVPVCPVSATWKREDGIIEIDYNVCIGCRYCITACPYQARTFDFGENWTDGAPDGRRGALVEGAATTYEDEPNFEYGKNWSRQDSSPIAGADPKSPVGNARKCHFCIHRVSVGMLPMCVTTCIGRATFFGDLNDPKSLVSELSVSSNAMRLKEELNTQPKVYYLV